MFDSALFSFCLDLLEKVLQIGCYRTGSFQQKPKGKMIIHLIREEPYRTVSDLIQQDHQLFGDIKLSQDDDLTTSFFMMCLIYTCSR